jgi:hypothetical protein
MNERQATGLAKAVIDRVIAEPEARRPDTAEQSVSEAITPSPPVDPSPGK